MLEIPDRNNRDSSGAYYSHHILTQPLDHQSQSSMMWMLQSTHGSTLLMLDNAISTTTRRQSDVCSNGCVLPELTNLLNNSLRVDIKCTYTVSTVLYSCTSSSFFITRCFANYPIILTDTAQVVCVAGSMKRSSIHLSVCMSCHSTAGPVCGGFAADCPAGRRYQSIAGDGTQQQRCTAANVGSVRLTAA